MTRLFFALWPDADSARELGRLARDLALRAGGKPVPQSKIHLTLAFLGDVADARLAAAASVRSDASAFAMVLDCLGSFPGARVAWAGCTAPPRGLIELQSSLAGELRSQDFALDDRPFAPHLTLVRRISAQVPTVGIEPIEWQAREFALMRSELGTGRYAILDTWRLPD